MSMIKIDTTNKLARMLAFGYIRNCIELALGNDGRLIGDFIKIAVCQNLTPIHPDLNNKDIMNFEKIQFWFPAIQSSKEFISKLKTKLVFISENSLFKSYSLVEGDIIITQVDVYTGVYPLDDFNIDHLAFSKNGYESTSEYDVVNLKLCIKDKKVILTKKYIRKLLSTELTLFPQNGLFDISSILILKLKDDYMKNGWRVFLFDKVMLPLNFDKNWLESNIPSTIRSGVQSEVLCKDKFQQQCENSGEKDFEKNFKISVVDVINDLYSRLRTLEDSLK